MIMMAMEQWPESHNNRHTHIRLSWRQKFNGHDSFIHQHMNSKLIRICSGTKFHIQIERKHTYFDTQFSVCGESKYVLRLRYSSGKYIQFTNSIWSIVVYFSDRKCFSSVSVFSIWFCSVFRLCYKKKPKRLCEASKQYYQQIHLLNILECSLHLHYLWWQRQCVYCTFHSLMTGSGYVCSIDAQLFCVSSKFWFRQNSSVSVVVGKNVQLARHTMWLRFKHFAGCCRRVSTWPNVGLQDKAGMSNEKRTNKIKERECEGVNNGRKKNILTFQQIMLEGTNPSTVTVRRTCAHKIHP